MSARSWLSWFIGALLVAGVGSRAEAAPIEGAGGPDHAWLALESAWRQDRGWSLYHAPGTLEPGGVLRVRTLASRPEAMTAWGDTLTLVYRASQSPGDETGVRQVRALTATQFMDGARYRYDPPARERVMPALPGWGRLIGVTSSAEGAFALLRDQDRLGLFHLHTEVWDEVGLPDSAPGESTWRLAPSDQGVALIETTNGSGRLWRSERADGQWTSEAIVTPIGDSLVFAAQQLISASRDESGRLSFTVLKGGQAYPTPGSLEGVPEDFAVVRLGDSVLAAWLDPADDTRLNVGVVSGITGQVLFTGPAQMQPVLTPRDLQYLALLLTAVLLMVLIFVLRPESGPGMEVDLPATLAPATEGRRLAAALIDFLPLAIASAGLWQVSFASAVGIQINVDGAGIWPLLTTLSAAATLQTLFEWLAGWTPGKWLCGCRTVTRTAAKISFRQAIVRNVVKFSCPPLLALVLADPSRRHPGDYFAGTVVVMRAKGEAGGGGEDGRPEDRSER